jgi:hypothetical protein
MLVIQPPISNLRVYFELSGDARTSRDDYTQPEGIRFEHLIQDFMTFLSVNREPVGAVTFVNM